MADSGRQMGDCQHGTPGWCMVCLRAEVQRLRAERDQIATTLSIWEEMVERLRAEVLRLRAEVAAEREACAQVAEGHRKTTTDQFTRLEVEFGQEIAEVIRARGKTDG